MPLPREWKKPCTRKEKTFLYAGSSPRKRGDEIADNHLLAAGHLRLTHDRVALAPARNAISQRDDWEEPDVLDLASEVEVLQT